MSTKTSDGPPIQLQKLPTSNLVAYKESLLLCLNSKEGYVDIANAIELNDAKLLTINIPTRPKKTTFLFPNGNPLTAPSPSTSTSTSSTKGNKVSLSPNTTPQQPTDDAEAKAFMQYATALYDDALTEWTDETRPLRLKADNIANKSPIAFTIIQSSLSPEAKETVEADSEFHDANKNKDIMLIWKIILRHFTHHTSVSSQITQVSEIIAISKISQDDNESLESLKTKHTTRHKLLQQLQVDINADKAFTELFINSISTSQYGTKKHELKQLFLADKVKTFNEAYTYIEEYRNAAASSDTTTPATS